MAFHHLVVIIFSLIFSVFGIASVEMSMKCEYDSYFENGFVEIKWHKFNRKGRHLKSGFHHVNILPIGLDYIYLAKGLVLHDNRWVKAHVLFLVLYDGTIQERLLWFEDNTSKVKVTILARKIVSFHLEESEKTKRYLHIHTESLSQINDYNYSKDTLKYQIISGGKI